MWSESLSRLMSRSTTTDTHEMHRIWTNSAENCPQHRQEVATHRHNDVQHMKGIWIAATVGPYRTWLNPNRGAAATRSVAPDGCQTFSSQTHRLPEDDSVLLASALQTELREEFRPCMLLTGNFTVLTSRNICKRLQLCGAHLKVQWMKTKTKRKGLGHRCAWGGCSPNMNRFIDLKVPDRHFAHKGCWDTMPPWVRSGDHVRS